MLHLFTFQHESFFLLMISLIFVSRIPIALAVNSRTLSTSADNTPALALSIANPAPNTDPPDCRVAVLAVPAVAVMAFE